MQPTDLGPLLHSDHTPKPYSRVLKIHPSITAQFSRVVDTGVGYRKSDARATSRMTIGSREPLRPALAMHRQRAQREHRHLPLTVTGLGITACNVHTMSLRQVIVPHSLLGRANAAAYVRGALTHARPRWRAIKRPRRASENDGQ